MTLTSSPLFTWLTLIHPAEHILEHPPGCLPLASSSLSPKPGLGVSLCYGSSMSPYHLSHLLVHNSEKADLWSAPCLDSSPVSGTWHIEGIVYIFKG